MLAINVKDRESTLFKTYTGIGIVELSIETFHCPLATKKHAYTGTWTRKNWKGGGGDSRLISRFRSEPRNAHAHAHLAPKRNSTFGFNWKVTEDRNRHVQPKPTGMPIRALFFFLSLSLIFAWVGDHPHGYARHHCDQEVLAAQRSRILKRKSGLLHSKCHNSVVIDPSELILLSIDSPLFYLWNGVWFKELRFFSDFWQNFELERSVLIFHHFFTSAKVPQGHRIFFSNTSRMTLDRKFSALQEFDSSFIARAKFFCQNAKNR